MTQFNGINGPFHGLRARLSAFLLILCMLIMPLTSCQKPAESGKTYESYSPESEAGKPTKTQTAFDDFTQNLFCEEITENTLNLHYTLENPASFGISSYPLTLGEFSQKDMKEYGEHAKQQLEQLKDFNYDKLTFHQQITYDILENTLTLSAANNLYPYYEEVLKPSIGLHAELPTLFAEYTFNTEQDIKDYLALLKDVPRYFGQIITYEQEKAAAGLFMSDYCADLVIRDCNSFIAQTEDNFLIATFEERLDEMKDLTSSQKSEYIRQNRAIVTNDLIDAWKMLIDALKKLKGSGKNEGGMCNLKDGKDYYTHLLKQSTGSDRTVKELEKITLQQINSDLQAMQTLAKENPKLNSDFSSFQFTLSDPEDIIKDLQQKMLSDFPELTTDIHLRIKYVSESMEDSLSPAFYLSPPIDNLNNNVIYINKGSSNPSDLYTTLAHEGYPGHLYQTVYSAACNNNNPIRQLFTCAGYSEGWATYVENLAYSYDTGLDKNLTSFMQHNNSANLGIYALLDFYINYEGWSLKETGEWLQNFYHIESDDKLKELYYLIVSQPCNYLKYYVGYLEILDLKADAMKELGDAFVLKDFHTFMLQMGDSPFYIIREYMKAWIETCR